MNEVKIMEIAHQLYQAQERRKELKEQEDKLKDRLAYELKLAESAQLIVPAGDEQHEYHIKNNVRITTRFDKAGLAAKIGRDREDLDYHGITKLVEKEELHSSTVAQFQSEGTSYFVSLRRKVIPGGQK